MKAEEVYELTTKGGASDFAKVIEICRRMGSYCLIGGLAVNCYAEPHYTLDAVFIVVAARTQDLKRELTAAGFAIEEFPHSLECSSAGQRAARSIYDRPALPSVFASRGGESCAWRKGTSRPA